EDGIRDDLVTGVQTCALPISLVPPLRTIPLSGGCVNPTLSNSAGAHAGAVSSIGAGTRELMRPAGGVPSGLSTVTCQYTPTSSIDRKSVVSGKIGSVVR